MKLSGPAQSSLSFYVSNLGKQTSSAAVASQLIPAQRGMDFDVAKYILLQNASQPANYLLEIQIFSLGFFATHLEAGNNKNIVA